MASRANEDRLVVNVNNLTFNQKSQETLIKTGQKSLKTNRFFQFIDIIMNDEKLRGFIDEFFDDWDDVKTSILVMKTYQIIDLELKRIENIGNYKINMDNRRKLMIGLIKEMMTDSECRQELVRNMNVFMGMDHLNCRRIIEKHISTIKD
jgi:hypothetical protein